MAFLGRHNTPHWAQRQMAACLARLGAVMRNEACAGAFLLLAAAAALALANSPWHTAYESFWHYPLALGFGGHSAQFDTHFLVNDCLMTLFFLAAGAEIRHELHSGALSSLRQAMLPLAAALGGVCLPALIYWGFNRHSGFAHGWAVPTATDIAFALGVLALLGKRIPPALRAVLLALAIIDDIIAVLIIACFYSAGLNFLGLAVALASVGAVALLRFLGLRSLLLYGAAGAVLWLGLWQAGIHPSLAGVALGLLAPALPLYDSKILRGRLAAAAKAAKAAMADSAERKQTAAAEALAGLRAPLRQIEPPVQKLQNALHLWVSFGIMPLFAFANAGVRLADIQLAAPGSAAVLAGIVCGLALGKPLGVLGASFLAVKSGLCRLPPHLGWGGMALLGLLAGIGFTMAIFVAMLAFADKAALSAATLAVLCGTGLSAALGLCYGLAYRRNLAKQGKNAGIQG